MSVKYWCVIFVISASWLVSPPAVAKDAIPHEAKGVAMTLFYNLKCEKLPPSFVYAVNSYAQSFSPEVIAEATKENQATYDMSPTLTCVVYKPIVERAMEETYSVWHR